MSINAKLGHYLQLSFYKKTRSYLLHLQNSSNSKLYNLKLNAGFENSTVRLMKFQMQAINFDVIISAIPLADERGACR